MKGSSRAQQQALSLCLLLCAVSSVSAAEGEKAGSDDAKAAALQINTDNIGDLIERQTAPALVRAPAAAGLGQDASCGTDCCWGQL